MIRTPRYRLIFQAEQDCYVTFNLLLPNHINSLLTLKNAVIPLVCPWFCCLWPYSSSLLPRSPLTYGHLNSIPMHHVPANDQIPPNTPSSTCDLFDHHSSSTTTPCETSGCQRTPSNATFIVLVVVYLALVIAITFFIYFSIDKHFVYLISKLYKAVRFASY